MADPANRTDRPGGGKVYTHPITLETFDSVTTVLDKWDKDGLKQWAANLAGLMALELLPQLMASMIEPVCGNTFNRCYQKHGRENSCERCPCGRCTNCLMRRVMNRHHAESSRRAEEGTECHEAINFWILNNGMTVALRPEVQPYFDSFLQFVKDYGLHPNNGGTPGSWDSTEATVINREYGYAGTSDGVIHLQPTTDLAREKLATLGLPGGALIRLDYKTREKTLEQESNKKEKLFSDVALQDRAYSACPTVMLPDGREFPNRPVDAMAILQLRPGEYTFRLIAEEGTLEAFLGILTAYRWLNGPGKKAFAEDPASFTPRRAVVAFAEAFGAEEVGVETVEVSVLSEPVAPVAALPASVAEDPWDTPPPASPPVDDLWGDWAPEVAAVAAFVDEHATRRDPNSPAERAAKAEVLAQDPPRVATPTADAPKKAAAKRAPRKVAGTTAEDRAANRDALKASRSASATQDPFDLVTNPGQRAKDGIIDAIKNFNPGAAQTARLADNIPF